MKEVGLSVSPLSVSRLRPGCVDAWMRGCVVQRPMASMISVALGSPVTPRLGNATGKAQLDVTWEHD